MDTLSRNLLCKLFYLSTFGERSTLFTAAYWDYFVRKSSLYYSEEIWTRCLIRNQEGMKRVKFLGKLD